MATGLQIAAAAGILLGLGVVLLIWQLVPAHPDLRDALERLSPDHARRRTQSVTAATDSTQRLGLWGMKVLPAAVWGRTPTRELAILRKPLSRFYGEKVLFFGVGVVIPPLFTVFLAVLGWSVPVAIPAGASLAVGAGLFLLPNHNVRDEARRAREDFRRALVAFSELVALERMGGSGHRQALTNAAAVGDSWIFARLREDLARSAWAGLGPWDVLKQLSAEVQVSELADLAQAMELSGTEGTQVAAVLRARAAALRSALLSEDTARANEVGERMSIPMSLLGVIFMAILVAPAVLRVMAGG